MNYFGKPAKSIGSCIEESLRMANNMNNFYESCHDSNEERHARELLALEEEARIRRHNLVKRINYEHCIQEQNRQDMVSKLKKEIHGIEKQFKNECREIDLDYGLMEGELAVLEENTDNRLAHLQLCHDNQVSRLESYMEQIRVKIATIQDAKPEIEHEIKSLERQAQNKGGKCVIELESKLEELRNIERDIDQTCFDTEELLRDESVRLINPIEVRALEQDLSNAQDKAKSMRFREEDILNALHLDNVHLGKDISRIVAEDIADLIQSTESDIKQMKKDLAREEATYNNLGKDRDMMNYHFKHKFESKLSNQAERSRKEKEDLKTRLMKQTDIEACLDKEIKSMPQQLKNGKKFCQDQYQQRIEKLHDQEKQSDRNFKEKASVLQSNQGGLENTLKSDLKKLGKDMEQKARQFENIKKGLENEIDNHTNNISKIFDDIDKVDRNFINTMSPRQGILQKFELMNKLNQEFKEDGADKTLADLLKLDAKTETILKEYEDEIEHKNNELQELFYKHRQVATNHDYTDRKVKIATRNLRNETNHLKCKIRILRMMISEQNDILSNLNTVATKSENELREMIKRSNNALEEERKRLILVLKDDQNYQQQSIESLRQEIITAQSSHDNLMKEHQALWTDLMNKINESKEMADIGLDLQEDINELGNKIAELDTKMNNLLKDHNLSIRKSQHKFATCLHNLLRQKEFQDSELKQQKRLGEQAFNLEKMISSLEDALDAINRDEVLSNTEEQEALKVSLSDWSLQNDQLISTIRLLRKKIDQTKTLNNLFSSAKSRDLQQHQTLHAIIHSELSNFKKKLQASNPDMTCLKSRH